MCVVSFGINMFLMFPVSKLIIFEILLIIYFSLYKRILNNVGKLGVILGVKGIIWFREMDLSDFESISYYKLIQFIVFAKTSKILIYQIVVALKKS